MSQWGSQSVKDYVEGFGANALGAFPLMDIKILQH